MPEQDPPKKEDPKDPTGFPVPEPEKESPARPQGDPIEQDPPKKKGD